MAVNTVDMEDTFLGYSRWRKAEIYGTLLGPFALGMIYEGCRLCHDSIPFLVRVLPDLYP